MSGSREWRAPRQHGAILVEPPLAQLAPILDANRQLLAQVERPVLGRAFGEVRREARQNLFDAAIQYSLNSGEPVPSAAIHEVFILAGHQPELFHPGVWFKNFFLQKLAQRFQATAVNLIIDTDSVKSTALKVPAWDTSESIPAVVPGEIHRATVQFDRWENELPYEERPVLDEAFFAGFSERVSPLIRKWPFKPMLEPFWAEVRRHSQRTPLLGERIVSARRSFERRWGCHNLEVPFSRVCQTPSFLWYLGDLLANLQQFHAIYNQCVQAYRRQYGIRSRSHPVPDLVEAGGWFELPFWIWKRNVSPRGRLMARWDGGKLSLRIGGSTGSDWIIENGTDPQALVAGLFALEGQGIKVRSRALTTTIFARLFVSDLFVHGIGGAKYDELTDEIIRRFYGVKAPEYLVATATLLLPLPTFPATKQHLMQLAHQVRDYYWNPERHLQSSGNGNSTIRDLVEQKSTLRSEQPLTALTRKRRFETLRNLTAQLRGYVADEEHQLRQHVQRNQQERAANEILTRRDYAFCLFPEDLLQEFFGRLVQ